MDSSTKIGNRAVVIVIGAVVALIPAAPQVSGAVASATPATRPDYLLTSAQVPGLIQTSLQVGQSSTSSTACQRLGPPGTTNAAVAFATPRGPATTRGGVELNELVATLGSPAAAHQVLLALPQRLKTCLERQASEGAALVPGRPTLRVTPVRAPADAQAALLLRLTSASTVHRPGHTFTSRADISFGAYQAGRRIVILTVDHISLRVMGRASIFAIATTPATNALQQRVLPAAVADAVKG